MISKALRIAVAVGVGAGLLAGAPPAMAHHAFAQWVGQSEFATLESGDVVMSYFDAKNIGSEAWPRSAVNLGTSGPRDRASVFYDPDHWINTGRPTSLDQATVAPGQVGRFTFAMHAPKVTTRTVLREFFEPVWDGHAWMGGTTQWPTVWLDYTVLPAAPPTVTITSVPAKVTAGEAIAVVADVRDNNRVADVRIQDVPATRIEGTESFRAELPSDGLAPGPHTMTVRATDAGGRATEAGATVEVVAPPGPGEPAGAAQPGLFGARVSSVFVWKGAVTRFTALRITGLQQAAMAQLTCAGRGCRFKRRTLRHGGGTLNVLKKVRRLELRVGAVLQLRLTDAGATKLVRWRMRRGRAPKLTFRCAAPGAKPGRCA